MFSIITIASSTTKPVEMVRAISARLLRREPRRYRTPKGPISDHQGAVLLAGENLVVSADGVGLPLAIEVALGLVDVGLGDGGADVFHVQVEISERCGIDLYADGGLLSAADADQADTGQLGHFLCEARVGEIFYFGQGQHFGSEGEDENRGVGRIGLAVDRRVR